jgi:hypothetical protein
VFEPHCGGKYKLSKQLVELANSDFALILGARTFLWQKSVKRDDSLKKVG